MNVFVHGSFGSVIGLLSATRVIKDDLYGSLYKDINRRMREDDYFYKDQPMLQRGLVPVKPTFNVTDVGNKKHAAYPIIKAYEALHDAIVPDNEESYFYTFGWSGLISQHRRRLEAVRLYNCLHEEVAVLKARGITPKIRLLAHSHGGNLCLNLAAIGHILKGDQPPSCVQDAYKKDVEESLEHMRTLLKSLPHRPQVAERKGQSRYDYAPIDGSLHIDELIAFGTPIQPETEIFCTSDTFDTFYNVYSGEDSVQTLDGFSTKQYKSKQRIDQELLGTPCCKTKVVQVKIMYNRTLAGKEECPCETPSTTSTTKSQSLWSKVANYFNLFSNKPCDPGHKELWFASWKQGCDEAKIVAPLPVVTFTPIILRTLKKVNDRNDIDVNLALTENDLEITTFKHDEEVQQEQVKVPLLFVQELKEKFKAWNPQDLLESSGIEGIYKHLM